MAKTYSFEVHTPYRLFYSDNVEGIVLTLVDGEIGIFANHYPIIAPVRTGILKIKNKEGVWKPVFISDGFLEVKPNKTILVVDAAELPEEINYERVMEAKKTAEDVLSNNPFKFEAESARAALKRAEYRLKVYNTRQQV